jgi:DNA primase
MIKQSSIELLKAELSIRSIVSAYITLDKKDGACCPFHSEKTPSFRVNENRSYYKCFGCGAGGDAIDFVMKYNNMGFYEAVKEVASISGFTLDIEEKEVTEEEKKALSKKEQMYAFNNEVYNIWRQCLVESVEAQNYLLTRHYSLDKALDCGLAFAPNAWGIIKDYAIDKGKLPIAIEMGLVSEKDEKLFDFFRNRIIFPIRDVLGRICGFSGRVIDDSQNAKYMNSRDSLVFAKDSLLFGLDKAVSSIRQEGYVVIVEGPFDVTSSNLMGFDNVVAASGTAFTKNHVLLLLKYTKNFFLLMDDDKAGNNAKLKAIDLVLELGGIPHSCTINDTNENCGRAKDLDEYYQQKQSSPNENI